jgi:hypothetical protein
MRRVASICLLLLVLLSTAPNVAATPAAPTLTGVEGPLSTTLSWTAPSGAFPSSWTLVRDADNDLFDTTFPPFPAGTTSYTDSLVPLPDDRFRYTVTYIENNVESDPSNVVERGPVTPPCLVGVYEPPGCCPITNTTCAKAEACSLAPDPLPSLLSTLCSTLCRAIDEDLLRVLHDIVCVPQWDPCLFLVAELHPTLRDRVEDTCDTVVP